MDEDKTEKVFYLAQKIFVEDFVFGDNDKGVRLTEKERLVLFKAALQVEYNGKDKVINFVW